MQEEVLHRLNLNAFYLPHGGNKVNTISVHLGIATHIWATPKNFNYQYFIDLKNSHKMRFQRSWSFEKLDKIRNSSNIPEFVKKSCKNCAKVDNIGQNLYILLTKKMFYFSKKNKFFKAIFFWFRFLDF